MEGGCCCGGGGGDGGGREGILVIMVRGRGVNQSCEREKKRVS